MTIVTLFSTPLRELHRASLFGEHSLPQYLRRTSRSSPTRAALVFKVIFLFYLSSCEITVIIDLLDVLHFGTLHRS